MIVGALVCVVAPGPAEALVRTSAAIDPALLGTTSDKAAGSCWEIKQQNPAAPDGDYWLLTPAMTAPQQFYCDQTTNGGGWVLVGKGRDAWGKNIRRSGQGRRALLSPDTTPMSPRPRSTPPDRRRPAQQRPGGRPRPTASASDAPSDAAGTSVAGGPDEVQQVRPLGVGLRRAVPAEQLVLRRQSTLGHRRHLAELRLRPGPTAASPTSRQPATTRASASATAAASPARATPASYLWSPTNGGGAIPYAQVYIRPHVTRVPTPASPPSPTAAPRLRAARAVASPRRSTNPWGVSRPRRLDRPSRATSRCRRSRSPATPCTSAATSSYRPAGRQPAPVTVHQPFLAAFDVNTGQWVSSFRPQLNEQVQSLATLPNGDVVAGGTVHPGQRPAGHGDRGAEPDHRRDRHQLERHDRST